jgi:hypothetical protein
MLYGAAEDVLLLIMALKPTLDPGHFQDIVNN